MNSMFKAKDKVFYFCLVSTLVVLGIIIYVSITSLSTEEFVELYWNVFKLENLRQTIDVVFDQRNISQSEVYITGDLRLFTKKYKAVIIDSNESEVYDSLCIDTDQNGIFCGDNEGPWNLDDTLFIDSRPFNVLKLKKDDAILANYPKEVNTSNFSVSFIVKSHYVDTMNFEADLLVNETIKVKKILVIEPNKMKISSFDVNLPKEGLYDVKIALRSIPLNKSTEIYFWVLRS